MQNEVKKFNVNIFIVQVILFENQHSTFDCIQVIQQKHIKIQYISINFNSCKFQLIGSSKIKAMIKFACFYLYRFL